MEFKVSSYKDFVIKFNKLIPEIRKDPLTNFILHPWFMNFTQLSPAQRVALKVVFKLELDPYTKYSVLNEVQDEFGKFDLEVVEVTEITLYEAMTGRSYDIEDVKNPEVQKNMINFIIGRRGGKCQKAGTTVLLSDGSRPIIDTLVGKVFEVPSFNKETQQIESKSATCIDNGMADVVRITTNSGYVLERTKNHKFLTNLGWQSIDTGLSEKSYIKVPTEVPIYNPEDTLDREFLHVAAKASVLKVPPELFSGSKREITFYLNCLFKYQAQDKKLYSSNFHELANVRHLLQRIGITSNINKDSERLYYLVTFQIHEEEAYWWDPIVKIEDLGKCQTYGLTVDGNETYINDVVEHNTSLASMLAIYFATTKNWKPYLGITPHATILLLSHTKSGAMEILDMIKSLVDNSPVLRNCINTDEQNTTTLLNLSMPYYDPETNTVMDSKVEFKAGVASSKTTRGTAAPVVVCDEIAHWNTSPEMKETDVKVLNAVRQNTKQFGKEALFIKLSNPGIKQGVLYEEFDRWNKYDVPNNNNLPKNYQIFKAPSWVWNPSIPQEEWVSEWEYNAENFNAEIRANFVDALSDFISPEMLHYCITKNVKFLPPEVEGETRYTAALDAAFKDENFTFTIVGHTGSKLKQYVSKGWKGNKHHPVSPTEVAEFCKVACQQYGISQISADQYAFQPLKEIFERQQLTLVEKPFSTNLKRKIYFNLKRLINAKDIELLDNELQTKEILELVVEQSNNGNISISHPINGTDDFVSSLALAAFEAVECYGTTNFAFEAVTSTKNYGIKQSEEGTLFSAPSAEQLADYLGVNFVSNADSFTKDKNGKIIPIEESDRDIGENTFSFLF